MQAATQLSGAAARLGVDQAPGFCRVDDRLGFVLVRDHCSRVLFSLSWHEHSPSYDGAAPCYATSLSSAPAESATGAPTHLQTPSCPP